MNDDDEDDYLAKAIDVTASDGLFFTNFILVVDSARIRIGIVCSI